ncbi:formimidoylglutamase [Lacinutrix sp. Bg11-31]|uniref:formimidoylglutamase n=1 Tax=Lacinutrix sp. Bg11-31 TaxID=2057808 RepID=UPI000C30AF82|nr:formimidoylglutamase [Lacinutrix sp. Bg11-31]AUC81286.1 arginase [Lacinutrix sp. Bg11-31]
MSKLVLMSKSKIEELVITRSGESKFGEQIIVLPSITNIYDDLINLDVKYVLIGLPEDVGVFANYGKSGTCNAWDAALKVLLNTQNSDLNHANKLCVLGYLDFSEEQEQLSKWNQNNIKHVKKARALVSEIDKEVSDLIYNIVKSGKIPIVIGGGHNNAYGNIKGTSLALNKKINVVNFDAHTDFRALEGRHSGNGFSYAFAEGFLNRYFIFGIHKNYTSQSILDETLNAENSIKYNTFEAIEVEKTLKFKSEMKEALRYVSKGAFGIEIDCDAIANVPSSAQTPSGFSVNQARQFVHFFGSHSSAQYLHICEAAPKKKTATQVGKLITYLITDFIRANGH